LGQSASKPRVVKEPPMRGQSASTKQSTPWMGTVSWTCSRTIPTCLIPPSTTGVQCGSRRGASRPGVVAVHPRLGDEGRPGIRSPRWSSRFYGHRRTPCPPRDTWGTGEPWPPTGPRAREAAVG
jgi:hypothetical protein